LPLVAKIVFAKGSIVKIALVNQRGNLKQKLISAHTCTVVRAKYLAQYHPSKISRKSCT
jgi:hypothetical protein